MTVTMKKKSAPYSTQGGVALVIALLLLVALTILGVASMSGSLMQERMAGNFNLQTLAFEAASAGVSASLEFGFDKEANWPKDSDGNIAECARGSGPWSELPEGLPGWSEWVNYPVDGLPEGISVGYRQRVGCFQPIDAPDEWVAPFSFPLQHLVLNEGAVRRGGEVLARRQIEVRLEDRGGDDACALRIEGSLSDDLSIKGSGPEFDGGEGGCSVSMTEGVDDLIAEIGNNHIGNYTPPPKEDKGHEPWNDPQQFAQLINDLKIAVLAYENYDNSSFSNQVDWHTALTDNVNSKTAEDLELEQRIKEFVDARNGPWSDPVEGKPEWDIENCASKFYDGNTRIGDSGNIPGGQCRIEGNSSPSWEHTGVDVGDPDDPAFITYVAGHLGNPANNSGSGIVIIEGGNCWSGTADFQGLQLILGGHYEIIGGGGGETDGSIVLTTLEERYGLESVSFDPQIEGDATPKDTLYPNTESADFEASGLVFNGGGNHKITFECGGGGEKTGLTEYIDRINECLETNYEPNCDPDGGERLAIASWREYVDRARWPLEDE